MKLTVIELWALFLCAFGLAACGHTTIGPEPNTLRVNIGAEPPSLDWQTTSDATSFDVVCNLMVGLTRYKTNLTCGPGAAQSWQILDDGKRYVFHLRQAMLWSDGRPISAYDFEYAWKRLLDPATASQYANFLYDIVNAFEFNTGKLKNANQLGVKALDSSTLEVRLVKPAAYFLYLTAFCPTYPIRRDVVEKWGNRWTEPGHLVCNGPFLLSKWQHEYKIELVANPRFVDGAPHLARVKMFMIPEQATAFALYENDELDFVDNRSFSTYDVERYRNSPQYRHFPLLRANFLGFNVKKPPFQNVLVRQAFSLAIDREIFPKILQRDELPLGSFIPPSLLGYSSQSALGFDPWRARQLLSLAGYPNGLKFPKVELLYPNREDTRLVVEAIQDQLKRNLNVSINLVNQEWRVYLETLRRDAPPLFRASWGADYPDPQTFMNLLTSHSGNNDTGWSSSFYDNLIAQAGSCQNSTERAKLYAQADAYLCKEEAPIVPTYLSTQNLMVKPWVHGIQVNSLDLQFFGEVSVKE